MHVYWISQMVAHDALIRMGNKMYDFVFIYHCRLTNALSITVEADCRAEADILVEDVIEQAEAMGITMPALHTFSYVTQREL